jgi:hypothetical protein
VTRVRALWTNADSSMAPLIRRTDSLHAEVCR